MQPGFISAAWMAPKNPAAPPPTTIKSNAFIVHLGNTDGLSKIATIDKMIFQKFVLFCPYPKTNFLIDKLLSSEVQSFIHEHALSDPHQLLLKYKTILGLPSSLVIDQIIGQKKAKQKFPSWFDKDKIIYPPSVNLEQASSEEAGLFKANKIKKEMMLESLPQLSALDLSGGFGVDSFCLSGIFKNLVFLEPNKNLLDIVQNNHDRLGISNIEYFNVSAESFLTASEKKIRFHLCGPVQKNKRQSKARIIGAMRAEYHFLSK